MDSGGLIIGLSIAVPVANRSFCASFSVSNQVLWDSRPFNRARQSLGAATTDGVYGNMAGFGITFISNFLIGRPMDPFDWRLFVSGFGDKRILFETGGTSSPDT